MSAYLNYHRPGNGRLYISSRTKLSCNFRKTRYKADGVKWNVMINQSISRNGKIHLPTIHFHSEEYRRKNQAKSTLAKRYGFTIKEVENVMLRRKGPCDICGNIPGKLSVDHDHETGKVRGLICQRCNTALHAFDNPDLFEKIKAYIG